MCDMIVAHAEAKIGLPEVKAGIFPGFGGTGIARLIGKSKAMSLILSGDPISGREMHKSGLINVLVDSPGPSA